MGGKAGLRPAAGAEPRRADVELRRRPDHREQPDGRPPLLGPDLKDVFQRYKALQGFDQRYQNGFDCQGLWVEVNVERQLGSTRSARSRTTGSTAFAEKCKQSVAEFSEVITDQSKRLGKWMDWDNDYYTISDTNIEYIWRFLKTVHERGWLYMGIARALVPALRHSISQHELIGSDEDRSDPSLYVRLPLLDEDGEPSSSGRRRPGRCRRTSPPPSTPRPST